MTTNVFTKIEHLKFIKISGTARNNSSDIAIASQRSSYSNLTPSPSTASTLTEDGKCANNEFN